MSDLLHGAFPSLKIIEAAMEARAAVTRIQEFRRHLLCANPECPRPDRLLEVPKMLPCLHRFCAECLTKELDRQLNNFNQRPDAQRPAQYRCPLDHCKELTGIQAHDPPHNLPRTDEFLENMVELYKLEESLANREKLCDVCKRQRADRVCLKDSCRNKAFCQDCADYHALDRAAFGEQDGHQFLQVENLRRVSEGPVACGLDQKPWYCRKNEGEQLRRMYYCSEHDKVLCAGCGNNSQCVSQHNRCYLTVDGWRTQFPNHRPEVTEKLNNVKELQDRFRQAIDGIETRRAELERERDSTIRRINELHQILIAELNRQKEKLLEKTREIHQRKKDRLEFHLTKVENASQSLNDVTDFVDSFLKVAKDIEFYYEKNQVSACLETIGERLDDYCVIPQEEKLMKLSNHDPANDQQVVKSIDGVMGKVFSTPCVPFFTIKDPHNLMHLQVGHQTTITVVSRDVGGTPVKGRPLPDLTAYLEATNQDVEPQVIPCHVKKRSGKYLITMQPHHPYPMKLHIFHERPKPFPQETIVDCPNEGSEVIVERGFQFSVL